MYALMGANGKITSKLARILLGRGHKVRVIGRAAGRMQGLRDGGADLAVGDIADTAFLASAFNGASAVYAMIPPDYASPDHRAWQNRAGAAIADALGSSGVKTVVSLSSAGAALPEGTGPIAGLHDQETRLRALPGVDVLHLRVGYFLENHLHAIGLIRAFGVYPGMIAPDAQIGMIATQDIAHHIANELVSPTFSGQVVRHLVGPRDVTMVEAARVLGTAAGRPGLAYVHSDPA
ncbi:MAG: NAD(P)H-binding protein [Burkholderiales bacterium]